MPSLAGKTAVVTGAASGIGRAVSLSLARRGCNLALADLNEDGLAETARMAGNAVTVSRHRLDVTDRAAVVGFPDVVQASHTGVDVLVNNAGVAVGGTFKQVSEADFEWLFEVNFWSVVRMTRAFLPLLEASSDARLVNVSSLFGLVAPPGQTAYSASKFAVRGFSNALRHELEGTRIGVTVVHPGGVATQIANSARLPADLAPEQREKRLRATNKMLKMPPAQAGEIIVKGIEAGRSRVIVGNDARFISAFERLLPVSYWQVMKRMMR